MGISGRGMDRPQHGADLAAKDEGACMKRIVAVARGTSTRKTASVPSRRPRAGEPVVGDGRGGRVRDNLERTDSFRALRECDRKTGELSCSVCAWRETQPEYRAFMSIARSTGLTDSRASAPDAEAPIGTEAGPVLRLNAGTAAEEAASCETDFDFERFAEEWRRASERLDALDATLESSEFLAHWLRIAVTPLGARGAVCEVRLEGSWSSGETMRASIDVDDRVAGVLALLERPEGAGAPTRNGSRGEADARRVRLEVIADVGRDPQVAGLLVGQVFDAHEVRSIVTLRVRRADAFTGTVHFVFSGTDPLDAPRACIASLLAEQLAGSLWTRCVERRLRATDSRLHAILEGAGDAILAVGPDDRVIEVNHATSLVFGYSREEALGMAIPALFPKGSAEPSAALRPGGVREMRARRRDGSEFLAEVVAGAGARQRGRTLLVRDASARRDAEAKLRQCERLASMGTLVAGLGHDLNNALLPLRAHLCALRQSRILANRDARDGHLRAIMQGLSALQSLADGLHLLAIPEERGQGSSTDVSLWWTLAGPLLVKALHDRAALEVAIDADLPRAAIEEQSLTRATLAILVNAAEAMPVERPRELARVLMRVRTTDPGELAIEFADNGVGMSEDARRRAFDAYFTTKPRGIGSGLGLPIVRAIVERVGGRVELDSHPGIGTTVRLLLRYASEEGATVPALSVGLLPNDGRLFDVVASLLRTRGIEPLAAPDPWSADICFVTDACIEPATAERWATRRPARNLVVIGSEAGPRRDALSALGATLVGAPIEISGIDAAIRHVMANVARSQEEYGNG